MRPVNGPSTPPWPAGTRQLRIGDVQVDLRYRQVAGPDGTVELPQRMFELLLVFLAEPHVLHTRAELFRRVWPAVIVEDANLSQSIWMLRKALGTDRKGWIRTVAKGGYVFEPPAAIEIIDDAPDPDASPAVLSAVVPAPAVNATRRSTPIRARWRLGRSWATAAVMLVALAGSVVNPQPAANQGSVDTGVAVVLIAMEDRAAPADQRWPTTLLKAWLGWKLNHLPELTLLNEADLAADAAGPSPKVVLLATGRSSTAPGEVYVRASFDDAAGEPIQIRGPASELPAMTDALSQQVIARLLPRRANERWPPLALTVDDARRFADAADAFTRRDWIAATVAARAVSRRAPDFGPARLQLALALAQLAQAGPAIEQMTAARALLAPLPQDASAVLDALQLSINPRRSAEAADAYAALAARYPARMGFALDQARLLGRSDRPQEARSILMRPTWARQPVGVRVARLLGLAAMDLMLGDPERSRGSALKAEQLIRASRQPGTLELGSALLLRAQADQFQHRYNADTALFERAAVAFEQGGAGTDALYARVLAETARAPDGSAGHLDELLAKARDGGYRRIEIDLLRRVAFQHYSAGQLPEYRARLEQALDIAIDAGDTLARQTLELDLLNEDQLLGNFASVDRRLAGLRDAGLQDDQASWVDQMDAYLAANRGQFGAALAALDRAAHRGGALPPLSAARLACTRAELLLATGDLRRSREEVARCGEPDQPFTRLQATQLRAGAELMAGDPGKARTHLAGAVVQLEQIPQGPDRWMASMQTAFLSTRAGELAQAEKLYDAVLPGVRKAGYGWLSAVLETGRAEVAAARGDWTASERHAAAARVGLPQDAWVLTSRLEIVAVVAALAGDRPQEAHSRLSGLARQAHRLGDVATVIELHSLMPPGLTLDGCNPAARTTMVARTGLRGATLGWLTDGLSGEQRWLAQQDRGH